MVIWCNIEQVNELILKVKRIVRQEIASLKGNAQESSLPELMSILQMTVCKCAEMKSVVNGFPMTRETTFASWLRDALQITPVTHASGDNPHVLIWRVSKSDDLRIKFDFWKRINT